MKVQSRRLFLFTLAGPLAVVLAWRPGAPDEPAPAPADAAPGDRWPATTPLRILAKRQITREVIAGRRPLAEAAALFRELNRVPPDVSRFDIFTGAPIDPSSSAEERLCRQVVAWVGSVMHHEPVPGREAVLARLEAELREMLGQPGGVRLPDSGAVASGPELLARVRDGLTPAERRDFLGDPQGGRAGPRPADKPGNAPASRGSARES